MSNAIDALVTPDRPTVEDGLPEPTGWRGRIIDTAASATAQVRVVARGLDNAQHEHGPCRFTPRGAVLPAAGDGCILGFDDEGEPYIQLWWPA